MKLKRGISFLLAICILVLSAGCSVETATSSTTETEAVQETIEKEESEDINDVRLRDNDLLYKDRDPSEIVTMYLTVYTGNEAENTNHTWEEINSYSVYDYDEMGMDRYQVSALLQVGDENGPAAGELGYGQVSPNCTVQIRGQTSSRLPQKNYKISVKDNKGEWQGQTTIALNKHQSDGLRFRNKLAYDLMTGIEEMMSLRTTFVHLYVKDNSEGGDNKFVDYGLYTQVEQLNKTALKAHGLNKDGHLYKINFFEFYRYEDVIKLADDPTYDLDAFEDLIEVKGDDDHSKLIEMLEAVNDFSIPAEEVLEKYFDIENLAYWMAFHILTGNRDTQSRNVYIYSPLNSDTWYFYSWDNDVMLRREENAIKNRVDGGEWETGVSNYWGNVLFQRALKTSVFQEALDAAVEDIKAYLSPERIQGMAEQYSEIVKPYLYSMPDIQNAPLTEEQYNQVLGNLSQEIEANYQDYKDSWEKPMPFYAAPPKLVDGKYQYDWDASFTFEGETITYSFELAKDYTFQDVIMKQDDLLIPQAIGEKLPPGQYFIRVVAKNASGETQYCFDYYSTENGKVYGTKCFHVLDDGTIVEDVYEE